MTEVCAIKGHLYSYPSKEACVEDGGVADEEVSQPASAESLSIIYSLPQVDHRPVWREAMHDYLRLEAELSDNKTLLQKLNKRDIKNLTLEEKTLFNRYVMVREVLEATALKLFRADFLAGQPILRGKSNWQSFLKLLDQTMITNELITCLRRLSHSKILQEDRKLVYRFITAKKKSRAKLLRRLQKKIVSYTKKESLLYNGWQSYGHITPYSAFLFALEGYFGNAGYERLQAYTFSAHLKEVLCTISSKEMLKLLKLPANEFTLEMARIQTEVEQFPIGTERKIKAVRRANDLAAIALARGISLEGFYLVLFREGNMHGLKDEDYQILYELGRVAESPEKTDDNRHRALFLDRFESFTKRFLHAKHGSQERMALAGALSIFYSMAPKYGFSASALDVLLEFQSKKYGKSLHIDNQIASLQDLKKNQPITVGPKGLPKEVVKILKEHGAYDLVANNLREIILTPEIEEGFDMMVGDHGGNALAELRLVQIDVFDPEGKMLPAWLIAYILVHEAAHVVWGRSVRPELLASTPNERQAFLVGGKFIESYLIQGIKSGRIDPKSDEAKKMAMCIVQDWTAARAANYALGYDADNFDLNYKELPSAAFLKSHGLSELKELDMQNYPTNLYMKFAMERYDELVKSLELEPSDRKKLKRLFKKMINGEMVLTHKSSKKVIALYKKYTDAVAKADGQKNPPFPDQFYISSLDICQYLASLMILKDAEKYLNGLELALNTLSFGL